MAKMNLYEVVKYGSAGHSLGNDGPDTLFLVRARTVDEAAALVKPKLKVMAEEFVVQTVDVVFELGTEQSVGGEPKILRGPYIENAFNLGWNSWHRSIYGDYWEAKPLAEEGVAEAFYDNGQKAAEITYVNRKQHGQTTRWYRNGELMFRGKYVRGRAVELHEYWYPCGAKQEELEYFRGGVKVTKWLEDGTLLEQFTEEWTR